MVSLLVYLCTFVITIYKYARPGRHVHAAVSMHAAASAFVCMQHTLKARCATRRLVETAIYSLLNDDDRRAAHNLFKEAAATM